MCFRVLLLILWCTIVILFINVSGERTWISKHGDYAKDFYDRRKNWITSNLGSILFKNASFKDFPIQKPQHGNFYVTQWIWGGYRRGEYLHDYRRENNPLEGCSVQNCIFTNQIIDTNTDAVIINIINGQIPQITEWHKNPDQLWILLNDCPPAVCNYVEKIPDINTLFQWTMTYRSDSDIPVPYGRTIPHKVPIHDDVTDREIMKDLVPNWNEKKRDVIAATYISNCDHKDRMDYLQELRKYVDVDVHGACGDDPEFWNSCPDYNNEDCPVFNKYYFYIALENSLCRQYLTEKVFYLGYSKGAIPVIRGPPIMDCEKMLPPNSTINADSYPTPQDLAIHLRKIARFDELILMYHRWRNYFSVVNEHGYFGTRSKYLCRVCEALNVNDRNIISGYRADDLQLFLNPKLTCVNTTWS